MPTQIQIARDGKITHEMEQVAREEGLPPEVIRDETARGRVVIPRNVNRTFRAVGVGKGLRTKINANIGASGLKQSVDDELCKLREAVKYGADSVMDLSTGTDIDAIRMKILENSSVMVGTVPVYQVAAEMDEGGMLDPDDLFHCIEKHATQGVDFVTVHCGITKKSLADLDGSGRLCGIVSRGGSLHASYIQVTGKENPLYERFDDLCSICADHDVTLSLGDGLRPGATADATDRGQLSELLVLGELAERARRRGVQVMIEGPGHVPLDQVESNVLIQKRVCGEAPFYVLGPLCTDVAPGYDHITGAIGGAIAAAHGADFLCYVTPAEHLCLPTVEDVIEGVVATRIAAHAGDMVKGIKGARDWDDSMSKARRDLDWEAMYKNAMDPWKARKLKESSEAAGSQVCTMCGELCAVKRDRKRELTRKEQGR